MAQSAAGMILDIKRFAVHDGPGIRTTAFVKGCSLRCAWCHSPESQANITELMYNSAFCVRCGSCREACPQGLLADGPSALDRMACSACGLCTSVCYTGALSLAGCLIEASELIASLDRDRSLHQASGGGVTISGGEPALQAQFVADVLAALRQKGHHTAVETSGQAPWSALAQLAMVTDLFLYDLKHPATDAHQRGCGAGNELVLENLKRLATLTGPSEAPALIVRVPMIPGFNDSPADVRMLASILRQLPRLNSVELLPYHSLGTPKYASLGRTPLWPHLQSPGPALLARIAQTLACEGIPVMIEEALAHESPTDCA